MTINVNEQTQYFHLQTAHTSYVMHVLENGYLEQVYYGARIHDRPQYFNLTEHVEKDATASWSDEYPKLQLDNLKQEYSSLGRGDFRDFAFQVEYPDGNRISDFRYDHYKIMHGKQALPDLPATFGEKTTVDTLIIYLKDDVGQLELVLNYSVFVAQDVLVRSAKFVNQSAQTVMLQRAYSLQLDLPDSAYDLMQFSGAWARERHLQRTPLRSGVQSIGSLRTASSHQQNPFMMLARKQTTEDQGSVYGFNLIYSGNFLDSIEVDQFQTSRILVGINPTEFAWQLAPGESFQTPEALVSYTDNGFNQLSQQLTDFYQQHLVNQQFAKKARPILINNWEATYFDFDEQKLLAFADQAKELGIELLVLDDGWFGHRDDDTTSLGDWFSDIRKLPQGVEHLAAKIHERGLQFGLWFEPEMISLDSQLYQAHPEWVIHVPGRKMTPSRHQYVLDLTQPQVVDCLFNMMCKVIKATQLDYIKWDMNRYITEFFSPAFPAQQQQELGHRYILGVYQLYAKLTQAFPAVLFESCASGGGRFDLGLMYYAPQAWTSDDTDAVERLKIQYGTSYGYALSMMGAHVSAVPNDQVGRQTSLDMRAKVAYFGDFGYELDITKLTATEVKQIKQQVAFYKKYRQLFQYGTFYRLQSPFTDDHNVISWQVVSADQKQAIAARYQLFNMPQSSEKRLYFRGLCPDWQYKINGYKEIYYGDELMNAGLILPVQQTAGDFQAQMLVISAV
ncbi:alpha-galactosidase [Bombilactobacillus thymidiniphilus]|uniref:Alpha-galactosidase n=1 Tax=Bombilactobacillus thymidiniphilus TaxID=2923363 RepID=A0ABY4PC58_9LACO|nr:alpha-galactosidase [Bombilactobacillus thymidiniphilus]UQS83091.1 alpha-galactosidase [Bombilactobacillus thymidiniphilus]